MRRVTWKTMTAIQGGLYYPDRSALVNFNINTGKYDLTEDGQLYLAEHARWVEGWGYMSLAAYDDAPLLLSMGVENFRCVVPQNRENSRGVPMFRWVKKVADTLASNSSKPSALVNAGKPPLSPVIVATPVSELVTFKKSEVQEVLNELLAVRNKVSDQFNNPYEEARFDRAINILHRAFV
jgi:hypothetical protein